jgi:hypothetical protein
MGVDTSMAQVAQFFDDLVIRRTPLPTGLLEFTPADPECILAEPQRVKDCIASVKSGKLAVDENINISVLKYFPASAVTMLAFLFTQLFNNRVSEDDLERLMVADCLLLRKIPCPLAAKDFRPISFIPALLKLYEMVLDTFLAERDVCDDDLIFSFVLACNVLTGRGQCSSSWRRPRNTSAASMWPSWMSAKPLIVWSWGAWRLLCEAGVWLNSWWQRICVCLCRCRCDAGWTLANAVDPTAGLVGSGRGAGHHQGCIAGVARTPCRRWSPSGSRTRLGSVCFRYHIGAAMRAAGSTVQWRIGKACLSDRVHFAFAMARLQMTKFSLLVLALSSRAWLRKLALPWWIRQRGLPTTADSTGRLKSTANCSPDCKRRRHCQSWGSPWTALVARILISNWQFGVVGRPFGGLGSPSCSPSHWKFPSTIAFVSNPDVPRSWFEWWEVSCFSMDASGKSIPARDGSFGECSSACYATLRQPGCLRTSSGWTISAEPRVGPSAWHSQPNAYHGRALSTMPHCAGMDTFSEWVVIVPRRPLWQCCSGKGFLGDAASVWYAANETWTTQLEKLLAWTTWQPWQLEFAAGHDNWPELLRRHRLSKYSSFAWSTISADADGEF